MSSLARVTDRYLGKTAGMVKWDVEDMLTVLPVPSALRKHYPASSIAKSETVMALDPGRSDGPGIYKVIRGGGQEDAVYGWQVASAIRSKRAGGMSYTITETSALNLPEIRHIIEHDGNRRDKGIQQILKHYRTGDLPMMGVTSYIKLREELERILPKRLHSHFRILRKWANVDPVAPSAEGLFFDNPQKREVRQFGETGAMTNDPAVAVDIPEAPANEAALVKETPPTPTEILKEPGGAELSTLNRFVVETLEDAPGVPEGHAEVPKHPNIQASLREGWLHLDAVAVPPRG